MSHKSKNSFRLEQEEALFSAAEKLLQVRRKRVLLIEDTAAHAAIIRRALHPDVWEVEHFTRAQEALRSFGEDADRIVLLDLSLPDSDDLQTLVRLRSINSDAPVIVVTSHNQLKLSVQAMQKGAWDYVVKSDPEETTQSILSALDSAWNRRLNLAQKKLREQAKIDELITAERIQTMEHLVQTACREIGNPLSAVLTMSQLLLENDQLNSAAKNLAENIFESAKELTNGIEKLRNIPEEAKGQTLES